MSEILSCAKCGSEKIIPRARIFHRDIRNDDIGDLSLVVYENPDALIFKGRNYEDVTATMCGECGYLELYVDNPGELFEIYLRSLSNETE